MKPCKTLILLALLLSVTALTGVAHPGDPASAYSTNVMIEPSGPGVFLLKAEVTNAAGEVVAGPSLKLPADDTAETTSTLPDSTVVELSATITEATRTASYSIILKKEGQILSRHAAKVRL